MKIYKPNDKLTFGKNKGYKLHDIYKYQPSYIEWLILNVDDFAIDIESFKSLANPTPISYGHVAGTKNYANIMNNDKLSLLKKLTLTDQNQIVSMNDVFQLLENNNSVKEIDYNFPEDVVNINTNKIKNKVKDANENI
jgi:hypothetical protein